MKKCHLIDTNNNWCFCVVEVRLFTGTSRKPCEHKNVSYEAILCPIIVMAQRAPNARSTLQIVNRHYEDLKSGRPDSQILKKAF